jgi:hypothetical protein
MVGVDAQYAEYEADAAAYARINALIDAVPESDEPLRGIAGDAVLRRSVFRITLEKICKRTKVL